MLVHLREKVDVNTERCMPAVKPTSAVLPIVLLRALSALRIQQGPVGIYNSSATKSEQRLWTIKHVAKHTHVRSLEVCTALLGPFKCSWLCHCSVRCVCEFNLCRWSLRDAEFEPESVQCALHVITPHAVIALNTRNIGSILELV